MKKLVLLFVMFFSLLHKSWAQEGSALFPISIGGGITSDKSYDVNLEVGVASEHPVLYPTFCFQFTKNRKRNLFEYLIGGKLHYFITGTGDNEGGNKQSVSIGIFMSMVDEGDYLSNIKTAEYRNDVNGKLAIQLGYRFMYRVSPEDQIPAYLAFAPNVNLLPKISCQFNVAWIVALMPNQRYRCNQH